MRILHTSDWHLGQIWNGRSRKQESVAFLDWLLELLKSQSVDVLIVAGDIFDTGTPGPESQMLYYRFLQQVSSVCRATVIIAGNHDSPAFLDAPKILLRELNIYVIGIAGQAEDEIIVVNNSDQEPAMIIAAVPFLRDRDIRISETGESSEEKENQCIVGIRRHYEQVCAAAETIRRNINRTIPLVVTGHLFVAGGKTSERVRDIHVGTLGQLGNDIFPNEIDYLALGHLHIPQTVAHQTSRRYSGSPIPMSFDEAGQKKFVFHVDFDGRTPTVEPISVPVFSKIVRIEGDFEKICETLTDPELQNKLPETAVESDIFVEIICTGTQPEPDLIRKINDIVTEVNETIFAKKEKIIVIRIRYDRFATSTPLRTAAPEKLEDLNPVIIFERLLENVHKKDEKNISERKNELMLAYKEILDACYLHTEIDTEINNLNK
ncbi:MAG: exonuclease SbcCD subunit D C-terminal domain-containing protein [Planctomycetaceae bacterium]|jgi:exonuclease SbcD|nr:exonuclease SbcCD subunit D C-terminal domain-containing protein [Planctomycetaceae bacterium]